jgi:hypothetical protein
VTGDDLVVTVGALAAEISVFVLAGSVSGVG